MIVRVAAWLLTNADTANIASANVQGANSTIDLIRPIRNALFPVTNVSLIQAMPKIETTAIMPAVNTPDRATSAALTLVAKRISAPNASITICTTVVIGTGLPFTAGSSAGNSASTTIAATPVKKIATDSFAVRGSAFPRVV